MADRSGAGIAGYSMGGYGAMRYSLAHPDLFGAAIVLSPAVYFPDPPSDSSTREFGAFGKGQRLFVERIYKQLNYPETFESFVATGLPQRMYIAVGDDEFKNTNPRDFEHDLDFEAHVLFNKAQRVENLTSELRVVDGGHDWDVWGPQFVAGAKYIFDFLTPPPVLVKATLTGTAGEERAGGVATDAAGNVYEAIAAGGAINGQPFAGDKDLVLIKRSPAGATLWTRSLGTARLERAYGVAVDPTGDVSSPGTRTETWTAGTPATRPTMRSSSSTTPPATGSGSASSACPRSQIVATRSPPTRPSNVYVTGYTRGDLAGTNQGDKDVYLAKLDPNGAPALAEAVRRGRRGQGLGRRRDRGRRSRRRDDLGDARHAGRLARRLGRALRRRRQPGLAAAVRHDGQRRGLGADGRRRGERVRRRVLGRRLRRPAGR